MRLLLALAAAGFAATAAQVLLLRELLVSAAGDEAAIGTGLAAWLLGITLGALAARRASPERLPRLGAPLLSLLALAGAAGIVALRLLRLAAAPPPGELPGLGTVLALSAATLLPAGALVGASFVALAAASARKRPPGAALARLYVAESVGSLVAGCAASLLVGTLLTPLSAALLAGLAAAALVGASRLPVRRAPLAALALLAVALAAARPLDDATEKVRFSALAPGTLLRAVRDTPYAHLALGGDGPFVLFSNGAYAATFPDPFTSEGFAHLAGSLAPSPRRILATSEVAFGALRFLLLHGPERVDLVEPDPRALAFVRDRLPEADRRALLDPRVRVVEDDPRRFLERSSSAWDLVLLLGPDPVTLSRARLLTAETFRAAAARLAPRGVLVVTLRTSAAALAGPTAALGGSVWRALRSAFPVVHATPGPESLLVAGFDPAAVTLDPGIVAGRFHARRIAARAFAPELFPLLLEPANVERIEAALDEAAGRVPPSRDDRPVSLLYALARRGLETASPAARAFGAVARLPASLLVLLVLLPPAAIAFRGLVTPSSASASRAAASGVAATGAAGMAISFLLLLSFQTREGILYGALGVLTAAFMLGLALGAAGARRLVAARPAPPRRGLFLPLLAVGAAFAAVALALPALARLSSAPPAAAFGAHALLLFAAGSATGSLFPVATAVLLGEGQGAGASAAVFESADHLGAAAAALLAGVVLVPALGMTATGLLAAAVVLFTALGAARPR
jgi:spermidine synthase